MESGETPEQTLVREFAEELSTGVTVDKPVHAYFVDIVQGRTIFVVAYGCHVSGSFRPQLSPEHDKLMICPLDRLSTIELPRVFRESIERLGHAA